MLSGKSIGLIGVQHYNVLLFISDAAPYMVKAANSGPYLGGPRWAIAPLVKFWGVVHFYAFIFLNLAN